MALSSDKQSLAPGWNRTYVACNVQPEPKIVNFLDGMTLDCPGQEHGDAGEEGGEPTVNKAKRFDNLLPTMWRII
jgi:hypothetical protein